MDVAMAIISRWTWPASYTQAWFSLAICPDLCILPGVARPKVFILSLHPPRSGQTKSVHIVSKFKSFLDVPLCSIPSVTTSPPLCNIWTDQFHLHIQTMSIYHYQLHSGRTLVFDQQTKFPVPHFTCSRRVTTYMGESSTIGQPTRPT